MASKKEYVSENANLMKEWNFDKNGELDPTKITVGSEKRAWWKCEKGHEWEARIYSRNNGRGCPYCSGNKVLTGYNDLKTVNISLAGEWDYEKNYGLLPEYFTVNSTKKVWWKCIKGHEWQATVGSRNKRIGCPYCSGRYAIKDENDLQTVNPSLAKEWNHERNDNLKPNEFKPNSSQKVWWKCSKGHEWQAIIKSRNLGNKCPYCSNRKVLIGYNDLQTLNPSLAGDWNHERNSIAPTNITPNSNKKVWWKCRKEHEWQATVNSRNNGIGCPVCSSERQTSFPEYAIVFYLKKYGLEVLHSYKKKGYELDVFIPSKNIAVEYDGNFWHKNRLKQDLNKNLKCKNDGIILYRIREELPSLNDSSFDYFVQKNQKDLPIILERVLSEIIGISIDVDLDRDAIAIENLREFTEKNNSLLICNPDLATEWNYEKNGNLKPEHLTVNSNKKVWWKCSKGHEWQASLNVRNRGNGCPYCAGKRILYGWNDLQTINPLLAKDWNYEKNNGLTPADVTPNSDKKVWWKCHKGHEWQSSINNRNKRSGCPYCSSNKVLKEYNDLQTINSALAEEWNHEKNNLSPTDITSNSNKKVWWKCSKGHEWQATVYNRNKGSGCPECAKERRKAKKKA